MSSHIRQGDNEFQRTGPNALHLQISVPLLLGICFFPEFLARTVTSPSPYWVLILCLAILKSPRVEVLLRLAVDQTGVGWIQSVTSSWNAFSKLRGLLRRPN